MGAYRIASLVVILLLVHVPAIAQAQAGAVAAVARTPWGDPDLQGTWDFTTITPLQRPPELAGREFLSEDEAAALERQINEQRFSTEEQSPGSLGGVPRADSDPGIYNLGWWWDPTADGWCRPGGHPSSSIHPTAESLR